MVPIFIVKVVLVATAISAVTIGVTVGIIYASVPTVENVFSCQNLQLSQFLKIVNVDGNIVSTWASPANSESCDVSFKIEYDDNRGTRHSTETSGNWYIFRKNPMRCTTITISVSLIIDSGPIGNRITNNYTIALGTVDNLQKEEVEQTLELSWEEPVNSDECGAITYRIENEGIVRETLDLNYTIPFTELSQCNDVEIFVTPFTGIFMGIASKLIFRNGPGTVYNLQKEEVEETLELSWEEPVNSDECGAITYRIENEGIVRETLDLNYTIPFTELSQCNDVEIFVTPFAGIFMGIASKLIFRNGPGTVYNLQKEEVEETLELSWEEPVNSDECGAITYRIENEGIVRETLDLNYTIPFTELSQCNDVEIFVTPFAGIFMGIASKLIFRNGPGTVYNLQKEEVEETLELSWEEPVNSDECGAITYRIENEGIIRETLDLNYTIPFTELSQCNDVEIFVTPFAGIFMGIASKLIFRNGPGTVYNLQKEEVEETLELSWEEPVNSDECGAITYRIENEGIIRETLDLNYTIPFTELSQCNDVEIFVTPFAGIFMGIASKLIFRNGPGTVYNLQKEEVEETLELSWEEPVNSDECGAITYRIENEGIIRETLDLNYTIPFTELSQCNDVEIFVTPFAGIFMGIASKLIFRNGPGTVYNLQKEEVEETLELSWEEPVNSDECGAITYRIENEGIIRETLDLNYTIPFTELSQCNDVEIFVTPFAGIFMGIASKLIFRNGPGTVYNLQKGEVEETLELSWEEPVNSDECGAITYRIENEGIIRETLDLNYTIPFTEFSQCNDIEIFVTPFAGIFMGIASKLIFRNGLRTVYDLQKVEVEETLKVSWEQPVNSDECGDITYRIKYGDYCEVTRYLTHRIPNSRLTKCIEIFVTPFSETYDGITDSLIYGNDDCEPEPPGGCELEEL